MAKTVKHVHRSAMLQVEEEGAQEETMRKVLTRSKKSPREHKTLALAAITFDPADNYRWGDKKGMIEDLDKGESAATYSRLRGSVDAFGVEEPIGVYPDADGKLRIIFGFTRYKAALDAKLKEIDAYVYPADISAQERLLLQGRENSTTLKRAVSWAQEMAFLERLATACGGMDSKSWSKSEKILGKAKSYLARMKRTWEGIPEVVRKAAQTDRIGWRAAESFYTKNGPKFSEKDAKAILDSAGFEKGKEVTITQARVVAAVNRLSTADPDTGEASIQRSQGEGVKSTRTSSKDLREHMVLLFTEARNEDGALIPEGGNTSLTEKQIDELADTPEAYVVEGMGIALGDLQSPFVEGMGETSYEDASLQYRHAVILRAFAEKFFGESDSLVNVTKGSGDKQTIEATPWLDAKGANPEDEAQKISNKKVLGIMVNDWAQKSEVEIEVKGNKNKKVEATLALKVSGFMDELDERIAVMQGE